MIVFCSISLFYVGAEATRDTLGSKEELLSTPVEVSVRYDRRVSKSSSTLLQHYAVLSLLTAEHKLVM